MWSFILIMLAAAFAMEWVAWATHKFVMHGFLWSLHRDHHIKGKGFFQRNDSFFLIFAVPSWLFIMLGMKAGNSTATAIGFGIALYGLTYVTFHEIICHRRLKFLGGPFTGYIKSIQRAHRDHHQNVAKHGCKNFGLMWLPPGYTYRGERV